MKLTAFLRASGLAIVVVASAAGASLLSPEARLAAHYQIEKVATPLGIDPQVGGLAATPNGRLAAVFHHGEVAFFNPADGTWKIFAEGLHEPLGVVAEADGSLLVMQRPELTRLRDTDRDGVADRYDTVWDGFGLSGNYHEFAFGPVRAPDGKVFVALNLASNGAPVAREVRGAWTQVGMPREKFYATPWAGAVANEAGRMYSRVALRGWVVQVDPATGEATPWASGFRSPDGIGFDASGQLFVDDNQGDWRGTSEVHAVQRGGFYGHPASLVWREDWDGTEPLQVPIEKLQALRTRPAIQMPHGIYANSPTQILQIPATPAWGALGGQAIVGEMNSPRLLRLLPEKVDGVWQGACTMFIDSAALKGGLHRLAFVGDTLYVGRTHLSWAGGEGMSRIAPTAQRPFETVTMKATPKGFRFEFSEALADGAADLGRWALKRYYYEYHQPYGSPQMDQSDVVAAKVKLSDDHHSAEVELPELKAGYIYDFDLGQLVSASGDALLNARIAYTLNQIPLRAP